ncbi:MAG: helix-turn-helix domain-containing protein [Porcipelethomonas sp.]
MNNMVGERIRYFRTCQGLSQEKLALSAGINPAFLGHLERGLKSPTMTTLDKIIEALNITYSEFFDDSIDIQNTEGRQLYIDIINSCVKRLSENQLKTVADIMLKILELTEK